MSLDRQTALDAIFAAIDEVNEDLEEGAKLQRSPETLLFGAEAQLDSILLVNLVSSAEQHLFDMTGQEILLASEAAMSRRNSPYRSAETLADYAVEVASGAPNEQ